MKTKKYRVYFSQLNQTYVEVRAKDRTEAAKRASRKWRKEFAQPQLLEVSEALAP